MILVRVILNKLSFEQYMIQKTVQYRFKVLIYTLSELGTFVLAKSTGESKTIKKTVVQLTLRRKEI